MSLIIIITISRLGNKFVTGKHDTHRVEIKNNRILVNIGLDNNK